MECASSAIWSEVRRLQTHLAMASTLQSKKAMSLTPEVGVFVDTNLGTHLAISVSPDITVRDFKRTYEREHSKCFSETGAIQVSALMVERFSCFYHLSDTMAVNKAFRREGEKWFLHAEVKALNNSSRASLHNCVASKVVDHVSKGGDVSHPSNPEIIVTSMAENPESNTKGNRKRLRVRRFRHQKPLLGKIGRLFYFTKKWKRRKTISLQDEVDRTGIETVGPEDENAIPMQIDTDKKFSDGGALSDDDYTVSMQIEKNKTFSDDCAFRNEVGIMDENLAYVSRTHEVPETSSEAVVSVSGIINKYFSDINEDGGTTSVTSSPKSSDTCSSRQVTPSAPTKYFAKKLVALSSPLPKDFGGRNYAHDKPEVGKRLLIASHSIGFSPSKKHPAIQSLQFQKSRRLVLYDSSPVGSVFKIPSDDEAVSDDLSL